MVRATFTVTEMDNLFGKNDLEHRTSNFGSVFVGVCWLCGAGLEEVIKTNRGGDQLL